ncbi:MAG: cation transporter, partial [Paracoccus sp. (in: a-proteobacteria)]|nr:cation transporter [Paracoccus sp. (in: a-proteobacteria)]
VHDLHIWALSTTRTALAAHVVWQGTDADAFIDHVADELAHDFGIGHVTLQLERAPCERAEMCLAPRPQAI